MVYDVLVIDDSLDQNCCDHWSHAIHPTIFRLEVNFDDNYFFQTLYEWLQKLLLSNKEFRNFVETNPLPHGKSHLHKLDARYVKIMNGYCRMFYPPNIDRPKEFMPKHFKISLCFV